MPRGKRFRSPEGKFLSGLFFLCLVLSGCRTDFSDFVSFKRLRFIRIVDSKGRTLPASALKGARDQEGNWYFLSPIVSESEIFKFPPHGKKLWSYSFAGENRNVPSFALDEKDGFLYAPIDYLWQEDISEGRLSLLSLKDGHKMDNFVIGMAHTQAIQKAGEHIYAVGTRARSGPLLHAYSLLGEQLWSAWVPSPKSAWNGRTFLAVNQHKRRLYVARPLCAKISVYSFEGKNLFDFGAGSYVEAPKFKVEKSLENGRIFTGQDIWKKPAPVSGLYMLGDKALVVSHLWGPPGTPKTLSFWSLDGKELANGVEIPWTPLCSYDDTLYFLKDAKDGKGRKGVEIWSARLKKPSSRR